MSDEMKVRTPCCDRAVGSIPFYRNATHVFRRTCPACRVRYQVVAEPQGSNGRRIILHVLSWLAINPETA